MNARAANTLTAMTRRRALRLLGVLGLGSASGCRPVSDDQTRDLRTLAATVRTTLAQDGRAALLNAHDLWDGCPMPGRNDWPPSPQGIELLRQRIVADYREGRTVEIGGWFVSETEAVYAVRLAEERAVL